jgi:hypothetical protein
VHADADAPGLYSFTYRELVPEVSIRVLSINRGGQEMVIARNVPFKKMLYIPPITKSDQVVLTLAPSGEVLLTHEIIAVREAFSFVVVLAVECYMLVYSFKRLYETKWSIMRIDTRRWTTI